MKLFPGLMLLMIAYMPRVIAQPLPDSTKAKINQLFSQWSLPNVAGCAVGVVKNDSLIFAKGYGSANLEYGVPNSPETIFHMASVSKQFTAFSIVLLARQGKLNLEDDIHKYLPWFPDLKAKITIRQLLNHTSGIRDQWQLLAISGTRLDDVITQEHIVKILSKQNALNFKPGEEYNYSNSNFTLLAEIVKSVTGQTLRKFTDSAIFKPLGMKDTHFHDDYTEIVKNRSYSYSKNDKGNYENSILSYSNAGATSLFTNINDMSKWVANFYQHRVGDQKDIDVLTENGKLNNGKKISYALGIASNTYRGQKQYSHSGGDAGYRTFVNVFPDLKLGFIVFSNVGDFNPDGKAHEIANLFISDTTKQAGDADKKRAVATELNADSISMKKYVGSYISEGGLNINIEIKSNQLFFRIQGGSNLLAKDSTGNYYFVNAPDFKFIFSSRPKDTSLLVKTPEKDYHLKKFNKPDTLTDKFLKEYAGEYYCPELDCRYIIVLKDHKLMLTNSKYDDTPLRFAGADHALSDFWWINHIVFLRNKSRTITGFEVNGDRVMHLLFNKIK